MFILNNKPLIVLLYNTNTVLINFSLLMISYPLVLSRLCYSRVLKVYILFLYFTPKTLIVSFSTSTQYVNRKEDNLIVIVFKLWTFY